MAHQYRQATTSEDFKTWFDRIDTNNDGHISREELKEALRESGYRFAGWRARRAVGKADLNHNRVIDGDNEVNLFRDYAKKKWGKHIVLT